VNRGRAWKLEVIVRVDSIPDLCIEEVWEGATCRRGEEVREEAGAQFLRTGVARRVDIIGTAPGNGWVVATITRCGSLSLSLGVWVEF
jgi:hypothetical protein